MKILGLGEDQSDRARSILFFIGLSGSMKADNQGRVGRLGI